MRCYVTSLTTTCCGPDGSRFINVWGEHWRSTSPPWPRASQNYSHTIFLRLVYPISHARIMSAQVIEPQIIPTFPKQAPISTLGWRKSAN